MISRLLAIALIIILSPIFIVCSLIILINDGFPILFMQKKLGKNHEPFYQYKFRTMKKNTPQKPTELFEKKDVEKYILKFGHLMRRFSIDEFPQLINIIKGDMKFIGPRPCMSENEEVIKTLRESKNIHSLSPGITGWAQVNGRDLNSFEMKVELDEYYFKNRSVFLDIKILFKTFFVVLAPKNIKH